MNYQEYKNREENKGQQDQPKVQFMGNFLKTDGASVIVRFPYKDSNDFNIEEVHEVKVSGSNFPQRVECTMESKQECPLCASNTKKVSRFLVKAVAYVVNNTTNTVDLVPVVWDRPMKYADELADKIDNYGDLSEHLFKIKRNGSGQDTTFSTDIILNKTVYRDDVYVKDFSSIEELNPSFLLIKRMSKYLDSNKPKENTAPKREEANVADQNDNMYNGTTVINPNNQLELGDPTPITSTYTLNTSSSGVRTVGNPTNQERPDPSERRPVKRFSNIK